MKPPGGDADEPDDDHAYNIELSRPVFAEFARSRGITAPVYGPDDFAWIDEPTSKCDRPKCCWFFRADRKACPFCGFPRGAK